MIMKKILKFFPFLLVSIFILYGCSTSSNQSISDDLQSGKWIINRNDESTVHDVEFNKNGNIEMEGESYKYSVNEKKKEFSLSKTGYEITFSIERAEKQHYKLELKDAKVLDPTKTIQRVPDLKEQYATLEIYK